MKLRKMESMKILCVTDQFEGSNHSAVEGIFATHLRRLSDVALVFFSKSSKNSVMTDSHRLTLSHGCRGRKACEEIGKFMDLSQVDTVIVRNLFPVLGGFLRHQARYGYRTGFWNSFPHAYRRLFEARATGKSVFRKSLEYRFRSLMENRSIQRCDFLILMSREFKESFYPNASIPYLTLPMGVSFHSVEPRKEVQTGSVLRLIYTGTVDRLRETDRIVAALVKLEEDFVLDIFTRSDNETVRAIRAMGDRRIHIRPAVPRDELLNLMRDYDLGIGLIPDNPLYRVSSPTKTLEYYAVGLPALVNFLPEYVSLFDDRSAFFCHFTQNDIQRCVREVLSLPRAELYRRGMRGREIVGRRRDYRVLSEQVHGFLESVSRQGGDVDAPTVRG